MKKKNEKIAPSGSIGSHQSSRSSFLPNFVHPACDMKFADTRAWLENLCLINDTKELKTHSTECQGPATYIAVCMISSLQWRQHMFNWRLHTLYARRTDVQTCKAVLLWTHNNRKIDITANLKQYRLCSTDWLNINMKQIQAVEQSA